MEITDHLISIVLTPKTNLLPHFEQFVMRASNKSKRKQNSFSFYSTLSREKSVSTIIQLVSLNFVKKKI
jgi:hypothetical protein